MTITKKEISYKHISLHELSEEKAWGAYHAKPNSYNLNAFERHNGWTSVRRWQRKSWIFIGAYSEDIFAGFAIVDAGYLGKAFCYIYFPKTGKLYESGKDKPFAFSKDFDADINCDWTLGKFSITPHPSGRMVFEYKGKDFSLTMACQDNDNGLSFLCPSSGNKRPFHYTYKNLLLPTDITFEEKDNKQTFNNLSGGLDFSKGFPPYHTTWNWVSFMGTAEDGTPVGINLVDQFNQNLENAVWWGNERFLIGDVVFDYSKPLDKNLWTVKDKEDKLILALQPNGSRKENINLAVLKSKFTQVFGKITGKIFIHDKWQKIEGYGVMEEHEAKW